jgi:hypothetical protein
VNVLESAAALFGEIAKAGLILDNSWNIKQNDHLDHRTSHIYEFRTLDHLREVGCQRSFSEAEHNYAIHRWRNFKRHEAWLALLFEQISSISLPSNPFLKQQDFSLGVNGEDIPFDLKVTRYPLSAGVGLSDRALADWFYKHQSRQGRFHLANRFFVVGQPESAVYDLDLARDSVARFAQNMSRYRHFIRHQNGQSSRAVILRQSRSD